MAARVLAFFRSRRPALLAGTSVMPVILPRRPLVRADQSAAGPARAGTARPLGTNVESLPNFGQQIQLGALWSRGGWFGRRVSAGLSRVSAGLSRVSAGLSRVPAGPRRLSAGLRR